jgi:hypothetical protein
MLTTTLGAKQPVWAWGVRLTRVPKTGLFELNGLVVDHSDGGSFVFAGGKRGGGRVRRPQNSL